MRILALEPYYGGSHRAFLDGWSRASRHEWTVLPLPAYKWKWRMRHAAVTFTEEVERRSAAGQRWDLLWCSDMLNLTEFLGLACPAVRDLPTLIYFHENQVTYPVRVESERDYQFAMTNLTSALAARAVWFNSAFHRDSFLQGLTTMLRRMPDHQPLQAIQCLREKAAVYPPGVAPFPERGERKPGPLRILWAARWEHDKDPEAFFAAVRLLAEHGVSFRLSVIGEQFRDAPAVFAWAREYFADRLDRWGYQGSQIQENAFGSLLPDRARYEAALREADVFVSTARHEFFGLSAVEAALAGVYPLVPKRLAYPEVFAVPEDEPAEGFLYEGEADALAARLADLAQRVESNDLGLAATEPLRRRLRRFEWSNLAPILDDAAERLLLEGG